MTMKRYHENMALRCLVCNCPAVVGELRGVGVVRAGVRPGAGAVARVKEKNDQTGRLLLSIRSSH